MNNHILAPMTHGCSCNFVIACILELKIHIVSVNEILSVGSSTFTNNIFRYYHFYFVTLVCLCGSLYLHVSKLVLCLLIKMQALK